MRSYRWGPNLIAWVAFTKRNRRSLCARSEERPREDRTVVFSEEERPHPKPRLARP